MQEVIKRVALLATGDELVQGDVANSHGLFMAQALTASSITPGQQLVVGDDKKSIVSALKYLAMRHQAIIITGGLGPTSDDLTRFAVAQWVGGELNFREQLWKEIKQRFATRDMAITENNRQQCLFLPNAKIIVNQHGSAHGCYFYYQDMSPHGLLINEPEGLVNEMLIVMLPGPPVECRPMFSDEVLPLLLQNDFSNKHHLQRCLLIGESESQVAQYVEKNITSSGVAVGYRAAYPYLEVKFISPEASLAEEASKRFFEYYKSNIVSRSNETALQLLQNEIAGGLRLCVDDQVTRGLFQHSLSQLGGLGAVNFDNNSTENFDIVLSITGLSLFWSNSDSLQDEWRLIFEKPISGEMIIPVRLSGKRSLTYVVEYTCWELLRIIREGVD